MFFYFYFYVLCIFIFIVSFSYVHKPMQNVEYVNVNRVHRQDKEPTVSFTAHLEDYYYYYCLLLLLLVLAISIRRQADEQDEDF